MESYTGVYIVVHYDVSVELRFATGGKAAHSQIFYVQVADLSPASQAMKA